MPSVSRQQQKLMHGIASGSIPAGKGKPSKAVAREFVAADHARGKQALPDKSQTRSAQNLGRAIVQGKSAKEV